MAGDYIDWCKVLSTEGHHHCHKVRCECLCHLPANTEPKKEREDETE